MYSSVGSERPTIKKKKKKKKKMYDWSDVCRSNVPEVKCPNLSKGFSDTDIAAYENNGSPIIGISPKNKMLFKA